ncbi:DUF6702 family protein [Pedobacter sp. AW31-3R]|uniref:DUF6702 family protein n=1 Tax=Pedobacter sp. AW31-3R TaxID=3445781 RepID=UPI003F9F8008
MLTFISQYLLFCYVFLGAFTAEKDLTTVKNSRHPLHLSSTEINYNANGKTMEISCRIFTDDFEDILSKKYKVKSDLSSAVKHKAMDELVRKYMAEHLQVAVNGKQLGLSYIGFENDKEAVIVYIESEKVMNPEKMETTCTVLYDLFDDQINIFHITYHGSRKSAKLNYPDKVLSSILK